jgi:hypothetical protein
LDDLQFNSTQLLLHSVKQLCNYCSILSQFRPERSQQNAERNERDHPPLIRLRSHGTMHSSYPVSSYVLPGLGEEPQAVANSHPSAASHVLVPWWRCGRLGVGKDADASLARRRRLMGLAKLLLGDDPPLSIALRTRRSQVCETLELFIVRHSDFSLSSEHTTVFHKPLAMHSRI